MISVITPSFNQGKYIERTIQSVLDQHIPNLEYVVVDGGSKDETLSILQRYSDQLRFVSEPDDGQAHAVNKGLKMTSGDIIAWLNSDDVYFTDTLKSVERFFLANPEVDIIYGKADYIDQDDQFLESYVTETWDIERLKQICFLAQPAVFFRRRVLEKFGYLDEKLNFCMDYEFWLRLALGGATFTYVPTLFAGYRLYPETKTVGSSMQSLEESMMMLRQKLGFVPVYWIIYQASARVKKKTHLRMPRLRYITFLLITEVLLAFRWNGLLKGICSCLALPKVMMKIRRKSAQAS